MPYGRGSWNCCVLSENGVRQLLTFMAIQSADTAAACDDWMLEGGCLTGQKLSAGDLEERAAFVVEKFSLCMLAHMPFPFLSCCPSIHAA